MTENSNKGKKIHSISWLIAAGGMLTIISLLLDRSEVKNALFGGLSVFRVGMVGCVPLIAVISIILLQAPKKSLFSQLIFLLAAEAFFIFPVEFFLFDRLSPAQSFISLMVSRGYPLLIYLSFCGALLLLHGIKNPVQGKYLLFFSVIFISAAFLILYYGKINWVARIGSIIPFCILTLVSAWLYYFAYQRNFHKDAAAGLFIAVFSFTLIRITQIFMGREFTPSGAYWGELADAFLHGHLYLESPSEFHDLTFYNGHWYVPNPPLPGLLLIPAALIAGGGNAINMTIYSAVLGALNAALIYLTLREAVKKELFALPENAVLWLTAAFVFGSDHFWLSTTGQMWFISQLLVVTFTVLGVLLALKQRSPWLCGICLGAAVLSRPNVFPVFFCLLGICLQLKGFEKTKQSLQKAFFWCLQCGIPVLCAVFFLLLYNRMRFDHWLDFGYTTINGAADIVQAAEKYGMFNLHFLRENIRVMFTALPRIDLSGERFWFYPYVAGYSMFLMSPYLLYAFRSIRRTFWTIGAWLSVLVTIGMLLLYHNTGAEQFGYRYILDAAAPLLLLIGCGMKGRASLLFKFLTVFAILQQFVGIYWWYLGR